MDDWDREERELKLASEKVDQQIYEVAKEERDGFDFDQFFSRSNQDGEEFKKSLGGSDVISDGINVVPLNTNANHARRLQQAQINSLTKQLENMSLLKKQGDKEINEFKAQVHYLQTEIQRLEKENGSASNSKKSRSNQMEINNLKAENHSLMKENSGLQSLLKNAESKSQTRELRLKRAMQSVEKMKQLMLDRKVSKSESDEKYSQDIIDLKKKVVDAEKRNKDLLHGFKLQMQLIDILKRQKVHIEASRLLDFTEKEFQSVLDWDFE